MTKGIILAGGSGSRLHPITCTVSKQLLPVYEKPMIYYPLSTLMQAGIHEILIISTPSDESAFRKLLGNGHPWGLDISYATQPHPDGLAQAFIIGEKFIASDRVCLILGDNIFYGHDIEAKLKKAAEETGDARIFAYYVNDPERYGVVVLNEKNEAVELEEKPEIPKSNHAVTGIYMYDSDVVDVAKSIRPSARGELEITDLNNLYIKENLCKNIEINGWWIDAGTPERIEELETKLI